MDNYFVKAYMIAYPYFRALSPQTSRECFKNVQERFWILKKKPVMNNCGYSFLGPVFNVSVHSDNPTIYQGELADLLCIVTMEGMALEPGILVKLFYL